MAIESAAYFRRLARAYFRRPARAYFRRPERTGLLLAIGMLALCGAATAQKELVTTSSVIPLQHPNTYCQIYQVLDNPVGDAIMLDVCGGGGYGSLYQLKKGSSTIQTITAVIDSAGTYFNEGMAMDAKGTIYISDRYGSEHIYRVPYNPADGTYDFSASGDNWEPTLDSGYEGNGTLNMTFLDSKAKDGSGLLFVSTEIGDSIMVIPVNADGTVPVFPSGPDAGQPEFQYIIRKLTAKVQPMVVDQNGNLYFIENPYAGPSSRVTGVFFIPASAYTSCMAASASGGADPTVGCISGTETALQRIDPGNTEKFNGLTLDAAGNVYVGDQSDGYGGTRNGTLMIPNESGSPVGVSATSFNYEDAEYLEPAPSNANPTIDYRGFIWSPTGTASNWSPNGSGPIPGTGNLILMQLGTANVGATPVGMPSATGTLFYSFSGTVTPASFGGSEPSGANFSAVATNPYPPTSGTTPAVPCTAGPSATGTATMYLAYSSCEYWFSLTPQGASSVGQVSGQLSLLDASGNVIGGSTAYLSGVGVGPAVSLLTPASQAPLATGLVTPKQVAGDSVGNSYVADSGLGKVLMFPAGSTTATAGTPVGTGLTAPTGVAVDGAGNVYIGDSGKVIEVPAVNGKPNPAGQVVLQAGLGKNLNLAVDQAQNVYAADPTNGRVVRIYNPQMSMLIEGITAPPTFGTFTTPTAVATDDVGNLYVADGKSLVEVNIWGGQTTITSNLAAPVTGLAVDASGSVDVAQSSGIIRIPLETAGLNFNDAAAIDSGGVTAPTGLGLDGLGNFYVTAASYNASSVGSSGAVSTPVTTPSLLVLNGAFVNFGIVSQFTQSDPIDVNVYNIGNAPLAFTGDPTFSGADPLDYSVQADGQNPCDTTGGTTIASASACQLGVTVTAEGMAISQANMAVPTDAVNAPTATASLTAYSSDLLCRTQTTITLSPATGVVYPGATTVTATTVPDPAAPCAAGGVPQGGNITLTLAPEAKGSAESTQTAKLPISGLSTFSLTGLNGGTYAIYVAYKGDTVYGGSSSSRTFTLTVAQAKPAITLSEPVGVSPVNSTYYVLAGSNTTLQAAVTSSVGSPTGSVQFLSGSTPADPKQNPVTLNGSGVATFNTSNLAQGTYNLTAVYSSDLNFATVTSPVITIVVIPPSALITANPPAVSTAAGTAVFSTLTVTALEGYSPKLGAQLYCDPTTMPKYAECTFDVPTIDIFDNPGVPQISHVTISSNIPVNEGAVRSGSSPIAFAGLFGLGLLGLAFRGRAKLHRSGLTLACLLLMSAGAATGLTGCTNGSYSHTPAAPHVVTPSGTYHVSIYTLDLTTDKVSSLPFTLTVTIQ
jgi:sugar lactone lactonase YvrE